MRLNHEHSDEGNCVTRTAARCVMNECVHLSINVDTLSVLIELMVHFKFHILFASVSLVLSRSLL